MISVKKIILFVTAFIVSCAILIVFNLSEPNYIEREEQLVGLFKINLEENLDANLNFILNNVEDKKDDNQINLRISYVYSKDLIDTVRIYRVAFYAYDKSEPEILTDGNDIIFEDFVGPTAYYLSRTFITNAQFDSEYSNTHIWYVYRVELPQGACEGVKN